MNENNAVNTSDNKMCLEQTIDGILWRFYYQKINDQWVRYTRIKVDSMH